MLPDYDDEISAEYIARIQKYVDSRKPANFKLTPIEVDDAKTNKTVRPPVR